MKLNKFNFKFNSQNKAHFSGLLVATILLFSSQNCSQPGAISVSASGSLGDLGNSGGGSSGVFEKFFHGDVHNDRIEYAR